MNPTSNQDFYSYQPPQNDYKFIIKCIFGVLLIFSGLLSILFFNSVISGLMRVIAGVLLLPPTFEALERATKIKLNRVAKYVAIIIMFQVSLVISFMNIDADLKISHRKKEPLTDSNKSSSELGTQVNADSSSLASKPDSLLTDQQLAERVDQRFAANNKKLAEFQDKYISGWDGSFRPLELYVKANMNDPDSFEYIETNFWGQGNYVLVSMKFRGNNSFGAKVINVVKAKVSWDGRLIEVVENDE